MNQKERAEAAHLYAMRLTAHRAEHSHSRYGTFGPASPVRRIDPKTGEVMPDMPPAPPVAKPTRRPFRRGYWHKQLAAKMSDDRA